MAPRLAGWVWRNFAPAYLALLGAAVALALARWPIVAVDTDLWYHLNAGRYIAAAHQLPQTAFFSFVRPEPRWLDYYWLAQLLFYAAHSLGGYVALIALRALLVAATFACLLGSFRLGWARGEGWGWTALGVTAVGIYVLPRFATVRPHDLSYLAIAGLCLALEARRGLWAVPALGLLWTNLHGIEYPVLLLLLGAYLGEWGLATRGLLPAVSAPGARAFGLVGVSLLAVLATPHGIALVPAPFTSLTFASQYIEELRPPDLSHIFSLNLDGLVMTRETLLTLVLCAGALAAGAGLRRERMRPAHLLLFAGGLFLLLRVQRFAAEFMLLAVPLLAAFRPRIAWLPALPRPLGAALVLALAMLPFRHLAAAVEYRCEFPLCPRGLPVGAVAFLRQVGARGGILNHPNHGGYLEWELPEQRVFADLQTPFLFSDTVIFAADQSFQDATVLARVAAQYRPAFLLSPKEFPGFGALVAKLSDYAPVFVDDASVLYASATLAPEVVAKYRLSAIDPVTLQSVDRTPEGLQHTLAEVARVNAIYPDGGRMRVFEGALALERGDTASALRTADDVIARHPQRLEGYRLRGDALLRMQRVAEGAEAYEAALAHGDREASADQIFYLNGRLWACYSHLGRHAEAYAALRRALGDLYRASVGYEELASLASSALDSGREPEGRTLLEFALEKTPDSAPELRKSLEARLRSLDAPGR